MCFHFFLNFKNYSGFPFTQKLSLRIFLSKGKGRFESFSLISHSVQLMRISLFNKCNQRNFEANHLIFILLFLNIINFISKSSNQKNTLYISIKINNFHIYQQMLNSITKNNSLYTKKPGQIKKNSKRKKKCQLKQEKLTLQFSQQNMNKENIKINKEINLSNLDAPNTKATDNNMLNKEKQTQRLKSYKKLYKIYNETQELSTSQKHQLLKKVQIAIQILQVKLTPNPQTTSITTTPPNPQTTSITTTLPNPQTTSITTTLPNLQILTYCSFGSKCKFVFQGICRYKHKYALKQLILKDENPPDSMKAENQYKQMKVLINYGDQNF